MKWLALVLALVAAPAACGAAPLPHDPLWSWHRLDGGTALQLRYDTPPATSALRGAPWLSYSFSKILSGGASYNWPLHGELKSGEARVFGRLALAGYNPNDRVQYGFGVDAINHVGGNGTWDYSASLHGSEGLVKNAHGDMVLFFTGALEREMHNKADVSGEDKWLASVALSWSAF